MHELDWLTGRRPEVAEPDEVATARARTALLAHVQERAGEGRGAAVGGGARRALPRVTAALAVAAVGAGALLVALPAGDGPTRFAAPEPAVAAPLVRLAATIQAEPAPTGDATLVLRRHAFPHDAGFRGADLYLDDGRYYYAQTRRELRDAAPQEEFGKRQIDAAKAAVELPDAQARRQMIDATWGPGGEPSEQPPPKRLPAMKGPTPAPQLMIDDNRVWMGSMDALIAGAGRADVRAGVMKLLATIPAVKVERGDGVLIVRNADFPDGYVETLIVDDETGILRKMTGGDAGKEPSVVVDYEIERVTARTLLR